jgi:hypothetical protein
MTFWILVLAALLVAPTGAEASHCKTLTQTLAQYKKISEQADQAEKRGQGETACKLRKQTVSLADKMLGMKSDCFHGGKEKFEFLATSARALEDFACNTSGSDEEFDLF